MKGWPWSELQSLSDRLLLARCGYASSVLKRNRKHSEPTTDTLNASFLYNNCICAQTLTAEDQRFESCICAFIYGLKDM